MIYLDYTGIALKVKQGEGKKMVFDPVRRKWLQMTPEEVVRQYLVAYLTQKLNYPLARIACEKKILVGKMPRRFDIIIYDGEHKPWMLVECKAPEVKISENTLFQLLSYQQVLRCQYWVLTNGPESFCADARDPQKINWLTSLPPYSF